MTVDIALAPALEPALDHARAFVAALTGSASTVVCFQTLDDQANGDRGRARSELVQTIWGSLEDGETPQILADFNGRGAGVYITVNEINGGRPTLGDGEVVTRKARHVTAIRSLFVDCDGDEPDLSEMPAPAITVLSARGRHFYWPVDNLPVEQFKPAQRTLAQRLGTDIVVNDPCRVMRLPGFWHRKHDPFLVLLEQIAAGDPARPVEEIFARIGGWPPLDLVDDSKARLAAPIPIARSGDTEFSRADALDLFRDWASYVDTAAGSANTRGGRNKAAYDIASEGLGRGLDTGDVLQVVLSYCFSSGLPEHEGQSAWRSACQRHAESPFTGNAPKPSGRGVILGGRTVVEVPDLVTDSACRAGTRSTISDLPKLADGDFFPTDTGSADRFAATFEGSILHSPGEGWMIWNGKCWDIDPKKAHHQTHLFVEAMLLEARKSHAEAAAAKQEAEAAMREAASIVGPAAVAAQKRWDDLKQREEQLSGQAKRMSKVADSLNRSRGPADLLKLAESQPVLCVRENELDTDPFLLNVENGIVDLRIRTLFPHDPKRLITRLIPFDYEPDAKCDRWKAFIRDIMLENDETISFLQRALGYTLTGSTREQVFFLCIGRGSNGKSTMLEVVSHIIGPYANTVEHTTILDQNRSGSGPSADVARLRGARFVTINEMPEGKRMDVNRIKDWTGGDRIVARHLYREAFEFHPAFKMWIRANSEPPFRETDEGTWRRVRVIPFSKRFSGQEQDKSLKEALLEEAPGILTWIVEGASRWFMDGLVMPPVIEAATGKYRNSLDTLQHFIDERVIRHPDKEIRSSKLYEAYKVWCDQSGERAMTQKAFSSSMEPKGFARVARRDFTWWLGINVREEM